jgi:hypothetical protein
MIERRQLTGEKERIPLSEKPDTKSWKAGIACEPCGVVIFFGTDEDVQTDGLLFLDEHQTHGPKGCMIVSKCPDTGVVCSEGYARKEH